MAFFGAAIRPLIRAPVTSAVLLTKVRLSSIRSIVSTTDFFMAWLPYNPWC